MIWTYIKGKATLIIAGLVATTIISLSTALWWKTNKLEKAELVITNANQTIANRDALLLQLHSDIKRQEDAIKDLNTLQDSYEKQVEALQTRIGILGTQIDAALISNDPIIKDKAIKEVQDKLDDEVINSFNCLMRASGDLTKECK